MSAERHAKQERRHARRVVGAAGLSTISAQQGAIEELANRIVSLTRDMDTRDRERRIEIERTDLVLRSTAATLRAEVNSFTGMTFWQRLRWFMRGA